MIDEKQKKFLKDLFAQIAPHCKWITVDEDGQIESSKQAKIEQISFDHAGRIYAKWRDGNDIYGLSSVDPVDDISNFDGPYMHGLFTNEEIASTKAIEHVKSRKLEKIAELEDEIKKLKESL